MKGKRNVTITDHKLYTGRNIAMLFSTFSKWFSFLIVLNKLIPTIIKFDKMRTLPPRTASRFGVIPHSEILNIMADKAIPFTMIVVNANASNKNVPILLSDCLAFSAIENRIIAITPIISRLNIRRNSLSVYGSFPVTRTATK